MTCTFPAAKTVKENHMPREDNVHLQSSYLKIDISNNCLLIMRSIAQRGHTSGANCINYTFVRWKMEGPTQVSMANSYLFE